MNHGVHIFILWFSVVYYADHPSAFERTLNYRIVSYWLLAYLSFCWSIAKMVSHANPSLLIHLSLFVQITFEKQQLQAGQQSHINDTDKLTTQAPNQNIF